MVALYVLGESLPVEPADTHSGGRIPGEWRHPRQVTSARAHNRKRQLAGAAPACALAGPGDVRATAEAAERLGGDTDTMGASAGAQAGAAGGSPGG